MKGNEHHYTDDDNENNQGIVLFISFVENKGLLQGLHLQSLPGK